MLIIYYWNFNLLKNNQHSTNYSHFNLLKNNQHSTNYSHTLSNPHLFNFFFRQIVNNNERSGIWAASHVVTDSLVTLLSWDMGKAEKVVDRKKHWSRGWAGKWAKLKKESIDSSRRWNYEEKVAIMKEVAFDQLIVLSPTH